MCRPLQASDINNIATILQTIVAVKQKANEISDDFCTTIDNVLDVNEESVFQSQQDKNSSSRIVEALNTFLETLVIGSSGKFEKIKRNYAVNIQAVQPQQFSGLTFSGIVRNSRISPLRNGNFTEFNDHVPQAPSSSISIPRTIFNESTITNSSRQHRIIFVLYKKTGFFKVSSEDTKKTSSRLNSFVIAGSIKGLSVRNLSNPVKIALVQSVARGDTNSTLCSYWNFTLGNWSQEGCMFKKVLSDGRILCNCNHLTNFAMLMDIKPAVITKHERILGVISYVGCALSLVGLTLTIITILILRELRRKLPMKILLNYCTALSLTLIVFLATPEGSESSSLARCGTAAVALHYFLLVAFLWMAVEAFSLYLAIIKARKIDSFPFAFMLKCCLFAWGTPAIIVAITMIVALDKYGDERNCRLHGVPFFVAFVTPVILILAGNIVVFCLVIRSLLTSGNTVTSSRKVSGLQQARQGIAIMVLLGLTWLFGFLAIDDAKLAFQWLFCIFNSLQGFLVFILFCILPAGTRQQLRKLCSKKSNYSLREDPSTGSTAIGKMYSVNDQCSASGDELKTLDKESNCCNNMA
ncbi:adhesion G- coupled receptor G7-like [Paramuricea clavata]|uniref:Adhesion G- coupled receptor G7-like n=1 Tax=Paramuricea clavata TaxID=317549 RepID=A0A6S7HCP4_PARCT|nr:adhesion G- coupled receptor G7-like [Paramuricea clavata]